MRHAIAVIGLVGALCSALVMYRLVHGTVGNHLNSVYLINPVWGLYYGIGFEPALIWYRIHGPYATNFLDVFAMIIYPIMASAVLYWAVFRLSAIRTRRKWIALAFGLSFFVLIPLSNLQLDRWWLPIFAFGSTMEPP